MDFQVIKKMIDETKESIRNMRIYRRNIVPKEIKQQHIDGLIIFTGLAAARPDGSTEVKAYWATDTGVLSIWNGSSWLSETFT